MVRLFRKLRQPSRCATADVGDGCSTESSPLSFSQEQQLELIQKRSNASFLSKASSCTSSRRTRKKKQKKEHTRNDEIDVDDLPLIDRIPTAIGYQSSGSEDEWLEERSRTSRYALWDEEEQRMVRAADEEEREAVSDRYSVCLADPFETSDSSFDSVEEKVGEELQREREQLKATIVLRQARAAAKQRRNEPPASGRGVLPVLKFCFGPTASQATATSDRPFL